MKIAIIGTRGIPNNYGGFEQFAEYVSVGLVQMGHEVSVYNSHNHVYQESEWNGVKLIHCYDPEEKVGTAGQFIYDLNCILDTRRKKFDIILQLGYTSSSIWNFLFPSGSLIITNMDGLEWKRTKYNKYTRKFLKWAEKLAIKSSDVLVADSIGIKEYLQHEYNAFSHYIAYGAELDLKYNQTVFEDLSIKPATYNLLIARMEPENNIEVILDGAVLAADKKTFIVVGGLKTPFAQYLLDKFAAYDHIKFVGAIYDFDKLNALRREACLYFHGHSVGGTNPSLLEAMASESLIVAHDNTFNKNIVLENGYYFKDSKDVAVLIDTINKSEVINQTKIQGNLTSIHTKFSWKMIIQQYEELFSKEYKKRG